MRDYPRISRDKPAYLYAGTDEKGRYGPDGAEDSGGFLPANTNKGKARPQARKTPLKVLRL